METLKLYVVATLILVLMIGIAVVVYAAISGAPSHPNSLSPVDGLVALLLTPLAVRLIMKLQKEG